MLSPEPATRYESSHFRITESPMLRAEHSLAADAAPTTALDHPDIIEDVDPRISSPERVEDGVSPEVSDDDAEGEPDEDFDAAMQTQIDEEEESDDEADLSSPRPGKRKKQVDEEDYMLKDPELYGLRRSVRLVSWSFLSCSANLASPGTCTSVLSSCTSTESILLDYLLTFHRPIRPTKMQARAQMAMFDP
jgi:hypothetical protein